MNLLFLFSDAKTLNLSLHACESWFRPLHPKRFQFAYDGEGEHTVHHFRFLWQGEHTPSVDLNLNFVHLVSRIDLFHHLLALELQGLFFVSHEHPTEVGKDVFQMRAVLPASLVQHADIRQACIILRNSVNDLEDEDLRRLSNMLNLPVYSELLGQTPRVFKHLINKLCLGEWLLASTNPGDLPKNP
jgi:hypothetical protein